MRTSSMFLLIFVILILILSCDKNEKDTYLAPCGKIIEFQACGVNDIGNNLLWLNDIINTSKSDKTGNYLGRIWYKKYNNQEIIVTDMILGSGGIMYHCFTCSGENIIIKDANFYTSLTQRDIVWTNICID